MINELSMDFKRINNYSGVNSDMKSSLYDKIKGRNNPNNNYFYLKRNQSNEKTVLNTSNVKNMFSSYVNNKNSMNQPKKPTHKRLITASYNGNNYDVIMRPNINNSHINNHSFSMNKNINAQIQTQLTYVNNNQSIKEGTASPSLSKMLTESMQHKDKLITNLKNSISVDKIRRKKIKDEERPRNDQSHCSYDNELNSNSFNYNSALHFHIKSTDDDNKVESNNDNINNERRDVRFSKMNNNLTNEASLNNTNSFDLKNNNSSTNQNNSYHMQICSCQLNNNTLLKVVSNLEKNFDELINSTKHDLSNKNNKILLITKNYSIYKKVFEEMIKLQPEFSSVFTKILNGCNEIVFNLLNECKDVKEKTENYEILVNKYSSLNKKFIENNKIVSEKNQEIEILKSKIEDLERNSQIKISKLNLTQLNNNNDTLNCANVLLTQSDKKEDNGIETIIENVSEHNKNIMNINKKVIEDLDALYFYDKIEMRSNSVTPTKVPKLEFKFDQNPKQKKVEGKKIDDKVYLQPNNKEKTEPCKVTSNMNYNSILQMKIFNGGDSKVLNNNYNLNDFLAIQKSNNSTKATNSTNSLKTYQHKIVMNK